MIMQIYWGLHLAYDLHKADYHITDLLPFLVR